jgi:hypothetical protein
MNNGDPKVSAFVAECLLHARGLTINGAVDFLRTLEALLPESETRTRVNLIRIDLEHSSSQLELFGRPR